MQLRMKDATDIIQLFRINVENEKKCWAVVSKQNELLDRLVFLMAHLIVHQQTSKFGSSHFFFFSVPTETE